MNNDLTHSSKRHAPLLLPLMLCFTALMQSSMSYAKEAVRMAIVLDDMGYSKLDLNALALPRAITFSILPYTPYAKKIAQRALNQKREILLHVPMQAKTDNQKLGKGALMLTMPEQKFKAILQRLLDYLPQATGINNHMGSTLTEHIKPMQWVMDVLLSQGLYFLDSRTTAQSVVEQSAKKAGVATLRRHIFLDNVKTQQAMDKQFEQALRYAQQHQDVVVIAHPYPQTINYLTNKLKQLKTHVQLVPLGALLTPLLPTTPVKTP